MNSYYIVYITGGTSTGLYTIYYNSVAPGYIANEYPLSTPATGLTLSQLFAGVTVEVPSATTQLFLYNNSCNTSIEFTVTPPEPTYPCLCIADNDTKTGVITQYEVCYNKLTVNGKPQYSGTSIDVTWNTNGYWELNGVVAYDGTIFRSTDYDNVPDSNWYGFGPQSANHIITTQTGLCSQTSPSFAKTVDITISEPSCGGGVPNVTPINDGSIFVQVVPYDPTWTYSLDNIVYQSSGAFFGLGSGTYTVYSKDGSNNITTQTVTLTAPPATYFTLPAVSNVYYYSTVGNMIYYKCDIIYDTSLIPVGCDITFDYELTYDSIGKEPGTVLFDLSNRVLTHNASILTWTNGTPLVTTSPLSCNPIYNQTNSSFPYTSQNITLVNGDIFTLTLIIGIDPTTQGNISGSCISEGFVGITTRAINESISCGCSNFSVQTINTNTPTEIYNG